MVTRTLRDSIERELRARRALLRLKRQLRARGITQQRVAQEANVVTTLVNNVLAGRSKSRNVLDTAKRLLAENTVSPLSPRAEGLAVDPKSLSIDELAKVMPK